MSINASQFENKYRSKDRNTHHTTHPTCDSYDATLHFLTVLTRLLIPKTKQLKTTAFSLIKNNKKMEPTVLMFVHHCATLIQARFRGYQQRKYYLKFRPVLARFKELLRGIVTGWKVRRILKLKPMVKKINRIKQYQVQNNLKEVRILKRQLIDELAELLPKGKWVHLIQPHKNSNHNIKTKVILRTALGAGQKQQEIQTKTKQNKLKTLKQEDEIENKTNSHAEMERIVEKQIPIKAAGFYKIPESAELQKLDLDQDNKKKPLAQKKKIKTSISKSNKDPNQKQPQIVNNGKNNQRTQAQQAEQPKRENTNKNVNVHNIEIVSVQLPIEEVEIKPQQACRTIKKNLNFMTETQKLKKDRKGIKVTLSSATTSPRSQKKQEKQLKVMMSPSYSEQVKRDNLDQIFSVYESAYSSKRAQIDEKYKEMKKQARFTN